MKIAFLLAAALALAQQADVADPAFSIQQKRPQMKFTLKAREGTMLGVDVLKASISRWTDDKGTSLGLKNPTQFYGDATVMTLTSGADLTVQIQGKYPVHDHATTMTLEGEIPLRIGTDLREGEATEVVFQPGSSFEVGPYAFKIAAVEQVRDSINFQLQDALRVTFTFDSPQQITSFDFLKEFKILTPDGKPHPSARKSFQGSFKGGGEHRMIFMIAPSELPLTVKWAVYGKIDTVTIPVKHTGPIGE